MKPVYFLAKIAAAVGAACVLWDNKFLFDASQIGLQDKASLGVFLGAIGSLFENNPKVNKYLAYLTKWFGVADPNVPVSNPSMGQKITGFFLAFFLMAGMASAMPLFGTLDPLPGGEDDFILSPLGSIEFNPSTPNNYGLALTESISFSRVMPGPDTKHFVLAPYAFFGLFGAANIGQWVATNGGAAVVFDYGVMVGLPKLDAGIPEVAFSYNFRDGAFLINVAFPADILPALFVHKL